MWIGSRMWYNEIAGALMHMPQRTDLHIFPGFGTWFYELNCQPKLSDGSDNPLRDPRVRQALAMSIDKGSDHPRCGQAQSTAGNDIHSRVVCSPDTTRRPA